MKAHVYFVSSLGTAKRVAEVDVPDSMDIHEGLEFVYHRLQNVNGSWSMGPNFEECPRRNGEPNHDFWKEVKFVGKFPQHCDGSILGERSMMKGDLVHLVGERINKTFKVAMFGFEAYKEAV